jgi:hypothetical protein
MKFAGSIALFLTLGSLLPAQATLLVPGQFASIPDAIDAAAPGDLILVSPGTYPGGIDFQGKAIEVRAHPSAAIIDSRDSAFGVRFISGEGRDSVLANFELRNTGLDPFFPDFQLPHAEPALLCESSPTIRNCKFESCRRRGGGAAMIIRSVASQVTSPLIEDCGFDQNTADQLLSPWSYPPGGPLFVETPGEGGAVQIHNLPQASLDAEFRRCDFDNNRVLDSNSWPESHGGAISVRDRSTGNNSCRVRWVRCRFRGNQAGDQNVITSSSPGQIGGYGGAIFVRQTSSTAMRIELRDCELDGNSAGDCLGGHGGDGGALAVLSRNLTVEIDRCRFQNNHAGDANGSFGGRGGAISFRDWAQTSSPSQLLIRDSLFTENEAGSGDTTGGHGGAISVQSSTEAPFGNPPRVLIGSCTFVANAASATAWLDLGSGGALHLAAASATPGEAVVANTILRGNYPDQINTDAGTSAPSVISSNVEGGFPGAGNFDLDPLFQDPPQGDFGLSPSSPCIDAGLAGSFLGLTDLATNPRLARGQVDVGCLEAGPWPGLPGTNEDLVLSILGGTPAAASGGDAAYATDRSAAAGESLVFDLTSPSGAFSGTTALLLAQSHEAQSTPPTEAAAYPGLWLTSTVHPLWGAPTILLGPAPLPPSGLTLMLNVPPVTGSIVVRIQGIVVTEDARNSIFAASSALQVELSAHL